MHSFNKILFRKRKSIDLNDDTASIVYDSYQTTLGNIMMITTLLAGFVVTGILLGINFTGDDTYTAVFLYGFFANAVKSTVLSITATLIAFIVSVRASSAISKKGVREAVRILYASQVFIGVSEMMMYLAFYYLLYSSTEYLQMTYTGPDICPDHYDFNYLSASRFSFKANEVEVGKERHRYRPDSLCADTAGEFFDAAVSTCPRAIQASIGNKNVTTTTCSQISSTKSPYCHELCTKWILRKDLDQSTGAAKISRWYKSTETGVSLAKQYFIWEQANHDLQSEFTMKMLKELSEGDICKKELAESNMEALCSKQSTSAEKQACAQAMQAYMQTDTCAGNKVDDILKCNKVCASLGSEAPKVSINRGISYIRTCSVCFLLFIVVCRTVRMLRDLCHTCSAMDEELEGEKEPAFHLKKLLVICWCLDPMDLEEESDSDPREDSEAALI